VLLQAWLLACDKNIEIPNLIIVGRKGWMFDHIYTLYHSSGFLKEKIIFLENVTDNALNDLYANCLFTVFPSHTEGWGLGATESLNHGKVCIVSSYASK
jgi:glycosyltransferase involved in cell wall biosynthesis